MFDSELGEIQIQHVSIDLRVVKNVIYQRKKKLHIHQNNLNKF